MSKTAFIAGCFDGHPLHPGHYHILNVGKRLGMLIVAINHDSYLRKKGPGRPLRSEAQRIKALLDTGLVTGVMTFESDPLELILRIKPDYILVGDDYTIDRVVGAKECQEWGGEVVIVPRIGDYSTTKMIEGETK